MAAVAVRQDECEMGAVDSRIDVHQIGGGDFRTATSAELCHGPTQRMSFSYAIEDLKSEVLTEYGISLLLEPPI